METIYTVIIALITVMGSAGAWKYYEKRAELRRDEENFIKTDCRDRIAKLEQLLTQSSKEKDDLRDTVLQLTREVAALHVKVDFLEKENRRLLER
jgi:phage shock protein A